MSVYIFISAMITLDIRLYTYICTVCCPTLQQSFGLINGKVSQGDWIAILILPSSNV